MSLTRISQHDCAQQQLEKQRQISQDKGTYWAGKNNLHDMIGLRRLTSHKKNKLGFFLKIMIGLPSLTSHFWENKLSVFA